MKTFSPLTAVHVASALERQIREPEANVAEIAVDIEYLSELDLEDCLEDWRDAAEETLSETE